MPPTIEYNVQNIRSLPYIAKIVVTPIPGFTPRFNMQLPGIKELKLNREELLPDLSDRLNAPVDATLLINGGNQASGGRLFHSLRKYEKLLSYWSPIHYVFPHPNSEDPYPHDDNHIISPLNGTALLFSLMSRGRQDLYDFGPRRREMLESYLSNLGLDQINVLK